VSVYPGAARSSFEAEGEAPAADGSGVPEAVPLAYRLEHAAIELDERARVQATAALAMDVGGDYVPQKVRYGPQLAGAGAA
jgi:hypothetical protein